MAYTRPSASAADTSWQGAASYTRPTANAADASFLTGNQATGFASTAFGAPSSRRVQPASGFLSSSFGTPQIAYAPGGFRLTTFGTPFGVFNQTQFAAGFSTTKTGAASTPLPATGFLATGFGASVGNQFWRAATIGPVTRFLPAFFAFAQTLNASGFKRSNFGAPFGLRDTASPANRLCQAFGFTGSFVSAPTSGSLRFGGAISFANTQLPAPNSMRVQSAAAFVPVFFGAPGVNFATHPSSLVPTQLGTPSLQITQAVISPAQQIQFGSPSSSRSRTYSTYGIYRGGRFGRPAGFVRVNRTASGFCSTVVGAPLVSFRSRATHLAPGTRFGTAQLTRGLTC